MAGLLLLAAILAAATPTPDVSGPRVPEGVWGGRASRFGSAARAPNSSSTARAAPSTDLCVSTRKGASTWRGLRARTPRTDPDGRRAEAEPARYRGTLERPDTRLPGDPDAHGETDGAVLGEARRPVAHPRLPVEFRIGDEPPEPPRTPHRRGSSLLSLLGTVRAPRHPLDAARRRLPAVHVPVRPQPRPGRPPAAALRRVRGPSQSLLGFRVVDDVHPDASTPYLFVANHKSLADVFLLCLLPWEMKFLSKDSIFGSRFSAGRCEWPATSRSSGVTRKARRRPSIRCGRDFFRRAPSSFSRGHAKPGRIARAVSGGRVPPGDRARRRHRAARRRRHREHACRSTRSFSGDQRQRHGPSAGSRRRPDGGRRPAPGRARAREIAGVLGVQ